MSQGIFFLLTVVLGAAVAFLFDIFRVIRKLKKHKKWSVHLQDAVFWLVTSLIVLYFILNYSDGEIRFFYLLGILLGGCLYFVTISYYIRVVLIRIIKFVLKIIKYVLKVIYKIGYPVIFLAKKLYNSQKIMRNQASLSTKKRYNQSKERLQKSVYYEKIMKQKKQLHKKKNNLKRPKRKNEKTT